MCLRQVPVLLLQLVGQKGLVAPKAALYTTPRYTLGVTFVFGCTTGAWQPLTFGMLWFLVQRMNPRLFVVRLMII